MAESAPTRTAMESTGRHRAVARPVGRRDRPGRPIRLVSMVGLGIGLLMLAIPFGSTGLRSLAWGGDPEPQIGVPAPVVSPPASAPADSAVPTPSVASPTGMPDPSATPPPTPRVAGSPTPAVPSAPSLPPLPGVTTAPASPAPQPPARPVLLGPDGRGELAGMMDRYCDAYVGGASWADSREDGGWECQRLLLPSRTVDLDRACRDTYGDGAFAENPDRRDAFGWRCFRR